MSVVDHTGRRFGKLTATGQVGRNVHGDMGYRCQCDCGNQIVVYGGLLHRKNCGCDRKPRSDSIDPRRSHKRCGKCKIDRPITAFPPKKHSSDGHDCYCRPCKRAADRACDRRNQATRTRYKKHRYDNNVEIRLTCLMRARVTAAMNGTSKAASIRELTGCSLAELKTHLEGQFQSDMTWENHGMEGWHIDHIRPCASFDLTDPEQQRKCFHYTNLQPLWAVDNLSKGSKVA